MDSLPMLELVGLLLLAVTVPGVLWRLFSSPLSKCPGPKIAAATLWYEFYYDVLKDSGGQYMWEIERMHRVYGKLVEGETEQSQTQFGTSSIETIFRSYRSYKPLRARH